MDEMESASKRGSDTAIEDVFTSHGYFAAVGKSTKLMINFFN